MPRAAKLSNVSSLKSLLSSSSSQIHTPNSDPSYKLFTFGISATGKCSATSRISGLAAMEYSPSRTRRPRHFYTSVEPESLASLPSDTEITPRFPDAYKNLCKFIDACTYPHQTPLLISQDARFDAAFLSAELERAKFEAPAYRFCCCMRALSSAFFFLKDSDGEEEDWQKSLASSLLVRGGRSDEPEVKVRALRDALLDSEKEHFSKGEFVSSFGEIANALPDLAQEYIPEMERLSGIYFAGRPTCESSSLSKIGNDVFHIGSASSKKSGIHADERDDSLSVEFTSTTSQFVTFERRKHRKANEKSKGRQHLQIEKRESSRLKIRNTFERADSENSAQNRVTCALVNRRILRNQYGYSFFLTKYGTKFHLSSCRHVAGKTNCSILPLDDECIDPCKHCLSKLYQTWKAYGFTNNLF